MPKYECDKCHKKFDNKTNHQKHINKKKDCTIKTEYFTCDKCHQLFTYKSQYQRHINNKFSCNGSDITNNNDTINNTNMINNNDTINGNDTIIAVDTNNTMQNKESKDYQCMNCYKWYATKRSLYAHQQEVCKLSQENKKNNMIDIVNNLKKELEKKNKIINKINNNGTINNGTINDSAINNGIVNNTNNTNNTVNGPINNTNITINAYGKEDLSHITDNDYKSIFNKCNSAIPMLIDLIHFNEKNTENANVYISNMRSQFAYIYDGKKWILKNKDELIDDIYDNKCIILLEKYDDLKNILNDLTVRHFEHFKNKYDSNDMKKNVSNRIELLLYNNRTLIKK
jgi:uncharacterized C2H2 Zn-finger protein